MMASPERFEADRGAAWSELDAALKQCGDRPERLGASGVRRLGELYRSAAADLAFARRRYPGDPLVARLEALVLRARAAVYARSGRSPQRFNAASSSLHAAPRSASKRSGLAIITAVEYEDRRTIATPEGVQLALPLAGIGTRFMAVMIDLLIGGAFALVAILFAGVAFGGVGASIVAACSFLVFYIGYQVLFEVAGGGRTVGKRAAGIRVVSDGGAPVGLRASLIRNIFLLLEGIPLFYLPASITVLFSKNNQRIGDHVAGTIVVREKTASEYRSVRPPQEIPPARYASWDVTGIGEAEAAAVRMFLERRWQLDGGARAALAQELATKLRPLVPGTRSGLSDEAFLEHLAAAKFQRASPADGG
jgi:uncharacterized RDD family membrane protein YckC